MYTWFLEITFVCKVCGFHMSINCFESMLVSVVWLTICVLAQHKINVDLLIVLIDVLLEHIALLVSVGEHMQT